MGDDRYIPETIINAERQECDEARDHVLGGAPGIYVSGRGWSDTPEKWEIYAEDEDR